MCRRQHGLLCQLRGLDPSAFSWVAALSRQLCTRSTAAPAGRSVSAAARARAPPTAQSRRSHSVRCRMTLVCGRAATSVGSKAAWYIADACHSTQHALIERIRTVMSRGTAVTPPFVRLQVTPGCGMSLSAFSSPQCCWPSRPAPASSRGGAHGGRRPRRGLCLGHWHEPRRPGACRRRCGRVGHPGPVGGGVQRRQVPRRGVPGVSWPAAVVRGSARRRRRRRPWCPPRWSKASSSRCST